MAKPESGGGLKYFKGLEDDIEVHTEESSSDFHFASVNIKTRSILIIVTILIIIGLVIGISTAVIYQSLLQNENNNKPPNPPDPNCPSTLFLNGNPNKNPTVIPTNLKVAFLGDQGLGPNPISVLTLLKNEKVDAIVHLGDFDYQNSSTKWEAQINSVLGSDFPYFAVIGNHDVAAWPNYEKIIYTKLSNFGVLDYCYGNVGINMVCSYKGLLFVMSGIGTTCNNHLTFIEENLALHSQFAWKFCAWHKPNVLMSAGYDNTTVDIAAYDICRKYGAVITVAHQHSYQRTYLFSNFANKILASNSSSVLNVKEGENGTSFSFVSGLGGVSISPENPVRAADPWWASIYTSTQNATYGAVICTFNNRIANCYFKNINGNIIDQFTMTST